MTSGSQATLLYLQYRQTQYAALTDHDEWITGHLYLQYRQVQCTDLTDHDKWITGHVTVPAVSSGPMCCPTTMWLTEHMLCIWKFLRHQITLAAGNIISLSAVRK